MLEFGSEPGANFGHYPAPADEVIAVEPDPCLYRRAQQGRARGQRADPGRGRRRGSVGLPGQRLDGAVATWVLCSVARPGAVAARLYRVLRPGGTLLVTEHVRSRNPLVGALQGAADTVWPLLSGGCHLGRDPIEVLRDSGFTLEEMTNFRFGIPPLDPAKPHVAALLRRPG